MLESLQGSADRRAVVVKPARGGFSGEGSALSRAGIPAIGYIPMPPPDGCLEKLSPELMHSHKMDGITAAQLKG